MLAGFCPEMTKCTRGAYFISSRHTRGSCCMRISRVLRLASRSISRAGSSRMYSALSCGGGERSRGSVLRRGGAASRYYELSVPKGAWVAITLSPERQVQLA